jgi:hypothetical protein
MRKTIAALLLATPFALVLATSDASAATVVDCGANRNPAPEEVLFFEHDLFNGKCWRVILDPGVTYQAFGWVGDVGIWNDQISSVKAGVNVQSVGMWKDAWFGEPKWNLSLATCAVMQDSNLGLNPCVTNFNDQMSSFEIQLR